MARMTKAQLQAKARAKGIKGYTSMTVDELKRAIAKAGNKPMRRTATKRKPQSRRSMADNGISKYGLLREMEEAIAEAREYGEDETDALYQFIDNRVIYFGEAAEIVKETGFWSGWSDSEYAPFDNISQVAYAALVELAQEEGLF